MKIKIYESNKMFDKFFTPGNKLIAKHDIWYSDVDEMKNYFKSFKNKEFNQNFYKKLGFIDDNGDFIFPKGSVFTVTDDYELGGAVLKLDKTGDTFEFMDYKDPESNKLDFKIINESNKVKSKFDEIFEDGNKIIAIDDIFYCDSENFWFDNDDIKKYTDLGYIKDDELVFPKGTTFTVLQKVGPSGWPVLTLDKTGDDFDFAADNNEDKFIKII